MALFGSPIARLRILLMATAAYALWTAISLRTVVRPSFGGSHCFEDTDAGNGTRYCVVRRAASTHGALVTVELLVRPGAPGFRKGEPGSLPLHSRGQQTRISVQHGVLAYTRGGEPGTAAAGQAVEVPAGEAFTYHNPSDKDAVLAEIVIAPAPPGGEAFFENIAGLARSYGGVSSIPPLQAVLLAHESGMQLRGMGASHEFAADRVLPAVARALGFRATYPQYASSGSGRFGGGGGNGESGEGGSSGGGGDPAEPAHTEL
ncbi:hypothetical protein Rsub_11937 [Raphidocelis subcapitata]|uniref:Uncharacterized protein n=1 Tax=Raphidocelis subcapitata TaxID=307507 RepID=A0A2V0PI24_9CHLO|nr:hypothetical protein Rsub_11937 [Raphidocelis subcapitata]|eukprot:GBF99451.1 hypothetical protein Rsub_11937 [Raphidocelis subcapitata]